MSATTGKGWRVALLAFAVAVVGIWVTAAVALPARGPANTERQFGPNASDSVGYGAGHREQPASPERRRSFATSASRDPQPEAPDRGVPEPPDLTLEQEVAAFATYFARLDAVRERGGSDPAFRDQVMATAAALVRDHADLKGASIATVNCGVATCRIEAKHSDDVQARAFLVPFINGMGRMLPHATGYYIPGKATSVMYFARAGADLPSRDDPSW